MPRPKTVSDEDVLAGALEVLVEQGSTFTLSDLARRVGLSRATLIQRFGDRDAILRRLAEYEVEATRKWLDRLPAARSQAALWCFLEEIVVSMGPGTGFSARVQIAALEARDPVLRSLANQRYELVQGAISARLPQEASSGEISEHIHAIIAGASMQWVATDGSVALSVFVLQRLRWSLDHLDFELTPRPDNI